MPGKKDKRGHHGRGGGNGSGTQPNPAHGTKRNNHGNHTNGNKSDPVEQQKQVQTYLEPAQRIEQARPFWEHVDPNKRKELLEIDVDKLLEYTKASLQVMEQLGAPEYRDMEEYEQALKTGIQRQQEKDTWKRWIWHEKEFASAEEFRDHLAKVARIHPGKSCASCGATTILGTCWKVVREQGGVECHLCGACKDKQEQEHDPLYCAEELEGIPPIQEREKGKEKEQPAEAALRERMKELISYVHDATRSFHEEHRQRNDRNRRHRDMDIDESREANITHIQHMLSMLSREQDGLYHTCYVPISKFASACAAKIDGRNRSEQELFTDLEILPYEDINRIYDFLLEKIETYTVKQGDPEEEEKEMGDIDLFAVSEDGKGLRVHPKWLQHLEERKLGEDGQPQRMEEEELKGMQGAALGLVLEWIYGSIICTAEKAREVARRTLADDLPAPNADMGYMAVVQQHNMMHHWQTMISNAKGLLGKMLENRKQMGNVDALKQQEEHTKGEVLQLLKREELLTQAKIEMLNFKHWAGEKEVKKLRTQLAVKEPQYQRLKLEFEEAKLEKFKAERGKGDGHGYHRNSEAVMQEHMELQTALQESTLELKRIQASLSQLQHEQNHRSQEISQLTRSWLGQIGSMINKLEGKPRVPSSSLSEPAISNNVVESNGEDLQQLAVTRSVMKQFTDDVKKQLYTTKEDLEVFNGIKEGIKNMERHIEDGYAVLSHLQTHLLNVSCDDIGAVIGGNMCLPFLQDKLDSAALDYAAEEAAKAEAAVIALEQEEELRKNAEKQKKERQRMKRKQKEREEREQKLAAEREALARKQAEEEEARKAAIEKAEEERIQRETELQERLKEEERLRELRKQQLLAEEGGYWKLRLEQELKDKAVYKEADVAEVESEEEAKVVSTEHNSSDSGWESTGKGRRKHEKHGSRKRSPDEGRQGWKLETKEHKRGEQKRQASRRENSNGTTLGRGDQIKQGTQAALDSRTLSEDSRTSSSSSSGPVVMDTTGVAETLERIGSNVAVPQVAEAAKDEVRTERQQEDETPDEEAKLKLAEQVPSQPADSTTAPAAPTNRALKTLNRSPAAPVSAHAAVVTASSAASASSSCTVSEPSNDTSPSGLTSSTSMEGGAKEGGSHQAHPGRPSMPQPVPQLPMTGPAPVFGSMGVPAPMQLAPPPGGRGMFFMPPQHGLPHMPVPMGPHMQGFVAPGMRQVVQMPQMYPGSGPQSAGVSLPPHGPALQTQKPSASKQLSVGAKPFVPSKLKEKATVSPSMEGKNAVEDPVPTMRLITKDKPLTPPAQLKNEEGLEGSLNSETLKKEARLDGCADVTEVPASSVGSNSKDESSACPTNIAQGGAAKARWATVAAKESAATLVRDARAQPGATKASSKVSHSIAKPAQKTSSDRDKSEELATEEFLQEHSHPVRSKSGVWKRAGRRKGGSQVEDMPDDAVMGTGLVNKSGDFNCFLNVIIQSLWHLEDFRRELLRVKPSNGTTEISEWGVVKALQNVFSNISNDTKRGNEDSVVDPTELREALSNLYEGSKLFRKNEMNDASEVLAVLFECICKTLKAGKGDEDTFVHKLFGLGGGWFFHIVFSQALRATVEESNKNLSTHDLLLETEKSLNEGRLDSAGSALYITGDKFPNIFTLVIAWHTAHATCEDIRVVVENLGEDLDVAKILGKESRPEQVHRLRGVVCFRGSHYHAYVRSEKLDKWLLFDDATIRQVGTWQNVKDSCICGQIQPSVLFYELLI